MNKAFVKETEDERASNPLPDRPIPAGPNYVTAKGLAQINEMIDLTETEHRAARAANDTNEIARSERDLRYWTAQRATAQLVDASPSREKVEFGSTVTIRRANEREQTFRIVGVDEADPNEGTLSHISPLAKALLGREKGEEITVGPAQVQITEVIGR
jgi:transcription elongation GreA/GreB family factor